MQQATALVVLSEMYVGCVELDQLGAYSTLLIPIVLAATALELLPRFFLRKKVTETDT